MTVQLSTAPDGTRYRDLNRNGTMDPYEDPRLDPQTRTADLLGRLTVEEKVGLMFQPAVPAGREGELVAGMTPAGAVDTPGFLEHRLINHLYTFDYASPRVGAIWNNRLQAVAEQTRLGIPVTISTDPRNAFTSNPGAGMASRGFSMWPEALGLAALQDEAAVREYAEAEERHRYYASQKADLEKAIDDLEKAIAQMNRESKRLFKITFDSVNARFKLLFPRMFRGGAAELRLTNPEDMLETGIEILAQPPGKKLGNIELMSGGEKALTAVSLIFSIFQHKPSPFCILDEVDAPLDEANVARYNEAIRSMTSHSQFILITHIKRTMQSVDVLYGVTMQEPGVSKLVSVRVNEAGRRPEQATPAAAVA